MSVEERQRPGWNSIPPKADFTATLFLFAWALLPVGFMCMMLIFHRFESFRLPLLAVSEALLLLTFASGYAQRKGSKFDSKMQLSGVLLGVSVIVLVVLYLGELSQWWWIGYSFCIGSVPYLFISLNGLAACDHEVYQRPWDAKELVQVKHCMTGWDIVSARWKSGIMASKTIGERTAIMYGSKDEQQLFLNIELLATKNEAFSEDDWGVQWADFPTFSHSEDAEE